MRSCQVFSTQAQLAANHDAYVHLVATLRADGSRAWDGRSGRQRPRCLPYAPATAGGVGERGPPARFYFRGLTPQPVAVPSYVERNMSEHMGSYASWQGDSTACALAARSWAALVYDPYDDRWHNVIMDDDLGGVWIRANPLVVCDMAEMRGPRTTRGARNTWRTSSIMWTGTRSPGATVVSTGCSAAGGPPQPQTRTISRTKSHRRCKCPTQQAEGGDSNCADARRRGTRQGPVNACSTRTPATFWGARGWPERTRKSPRKPARK